MQARHLTQVRVVLGVDDQDLVGDITRPLLGARSGGEAEAGLDGPIPTIDRRSPTADRRPLTADR